MILPDVNILIHAYESGSSDHAEAREWWEKTLDGPRPVGLAWITALGFIRIMTSRSVLGTPMTVVDAIRRVRAWFHHPNVQIVTPGENHGDVLFRLLEELSAGGNLTTDSHLAALAIEYRAEIATTDNDFARFRGLRWFNPLAVKQPRRRH